LTCTSDIQYYIPKKVLDGFWNHVNAQEVANIIQKYCTEHMDQETANQIDTPGSGTKRARTRSYSVSSACSLSDNESYADINSLQQKIASALLRRCIRNAAHTSRMKSKVLSAMPAGKSRRDIVDDITIMVILFEDKIGYRA
jgi:hypothetical protein